MKATELRISNLLLYNSDFNSGEQWDVVDVNIETLSWALSNQEQFNRVHKPIRLTEDWLLRFGFEEVKPRSGVQKSFIKNGIRINLSNSGNFYFKELPVKVHTLQNIFYFNTGNELTLTTPTP